jgi:hypothetical protein
MFHDHCPSCGEPLNVYPYLECERPSSFEDLAFRCERCGIGFSNAKNPAQRRRIYRDPEHNVPAEAREGLLAALDGAVNLRNRPSKRFKFGSESSEDAVTWTVFSDLRLRVKLDALLEASDRDVCTASEPTILLWGHPVGGPQAQELARHLKDISAELGEKARSRSEPDVVVAWDHLVVFVEVKLYSQNDVQPDYGGFPLYVEGREHLFHNPLEVPRRGFYELTRNWVIASEIAGGTGRRMRLINLGPSGLRHSADMFGETLHQSADRRFGFRPWSDVLHDAEPLSAWLRAYLTRNNLDGLLSP